MPDNLAKPSLGPKRFLLFAGELFYPEGGWKDFIASFETLIEAMPKSGEYNWYHVIDLDTGGKVAGMG